MSRILNEEPTTQYVLLVYISEYLHRLEWRSIPTTYYYTPPAGIGDDTRRFVFHPAASSFFLLSSFPSIDGGPCMWCFRPCGAPPSSSPRFLVVVVLAGHDYWCPSFYFCTGGTARGSDVVNGKPAAESPPPILAARGDAAVTTSWRLHRHYWIIVFIKISPCSFCIFLLITPKISFYFWEWIFYELSNK